jgi:hypothetical protein
VTSIERNAFYGCSRLRNITLPGNLVSIGDGAFAESGLTNVVIPNSVTSIGNAAFAFCGDLTAITIPASVTFIGEAAFAGCENLVVTCQEGSYAHDYCVRNGIPFILG